MVQLMNGHRVHRSGVADPDSRSHCSWTILGCVTPISLLPRIGGFSCSGSMGPGLAYDTRAFGRFLDWIVLLVFSIFIGKFA